MKSDGALNDLDQRHVADVQAQMAAAKGEALADLKGLERALGSMLPPIRGEFRA